MKNNNKKRFVAIALVRTILFLGGAILINNSEKWSIGYIFRVCNCTVCFSFNFL